VAIVNFKVAGNGPGWARRSNRHRLSVLTG
jgi:hypothetical protein